MPTMILYGDEAGGFVRGANATYLTARSTAESMGAGMTVGQAFVTPTYTCYEGFLAFDTSLVSNPTSATLSMVDASDQSDTNFVIEARLYDWGTTLAHADFVAGASISQTLLASYDTVVPMTGAVYHDFTDVAMVANLNLAGFTRIMLNSDRHRLGTTPTGFEDVLLRGADTGGTTQDPKLTVVGDVGNPGGPGPVPDDDNTMLPWQQIVA